ncbi:pyridoxamine 5'-phosphate oxidase family protein [Megalodesulfovibrio gigas]|uniref:pyridoxamine 5'-phosphate oxidase family protein n=1 Tax=Megalodesulfovibrio gigas TaxID=879 RepID=UPI000AB05ED4|nr:pyridoxamine 5'-phosphate oxidase family protein [Megalodesulfovibrio gigas]
MPTSSAPAALLIGRCLDLLDASDLAVLATCPARADAPPHCSLMAYALDAERRHLLLTTPQDSRKYANLMENPRVSLLVDTRQVHAREAVQALTVSAVLADTPPEAAAGLRARFLARHPRLTEFASRPDTALIRLRLTAFQLLDGVEHAQYVSLV